jgi:hypothetical protein
MRIVKLLRKRPSEWLESAVMLLYLLVLLVLLVLLLIVRLSRRSMATQTMSFQSPSL